MVLDEINNEPYIKSRLNGRRQVKYKPHLIHPGLVNIHCPKLRPIRRKMP